MGIVRLDFSAFIHPALNFFLLFRSPKLLYQSKLHTLRNPMMYTLPKFESEKRQEATLITYKNLLGKETEDDASNMRRNWCLNIYGWHNYTFLDTILLIYSTANQTRSYATQRKIVFRPWLTVNSAGKARVESCRLIIELLRCNFMRLIVTTSKQTTYWTSTIFNSFQ